MSDFVDYLLESLAPLKQVRARKMFGGFGIFKGELMFGLVADEVLYLKVDEETIPDFEKLELAPFVYDKNGKKMAMSYYQAPEDAMDSSSELCEWGQKAYQAACRAKKLKSASPSIRKSRLRKKK